MQQFVPLEKMSKKAQRAYHAAKRGSWYGVDPVTKTVPAAKQYRRAKQKREDRKASRGVRMWKVHFFKNVKSNE